MAGASRFASTRVSRKAASTCSRARRCRARHADSALAHTLLSRRRPSRAPHPDMLGVVFSGHPDARRWTRHQAWKDSEFPLRRDFPAAGRPPAQTPTDHEYSFLLAQGSGVYEIPVGPVHAGIIEPGHFRFQAMGETGAEARRAPRLHPQGHREDRRGPRSPKGSRVWPAASRATPPSRTPGRRAWRWSARPAWTAPPRAVWLRALMCERERVANHVGDIGAILNDVGFAFGFYQFARLREEWQRRLARSLRPPLHDGLRRPRRRGGGPR